MPKVHGWMLSAGAGAFTTAWTIHEGKFVGLPKLDRKVGIPMSIALFILSAYLYKKEHDHVWVMHHGIPHIPSEAAAGYAHNPAIPIQQPLGALTGPGLTTDFNKPASSILPFPDNVARAQTHL